MVKSARGVGLSAVLGLMSAGAWFACSSSNAPLMPLPPADAGGAKEGGSGSSSGGGSGSSSGGGSGSSSGSSSGGGSGSSSGSGSGSSSGGGSGSSSGSSGAADGGGEGGADAGAVSCSTYCAAIMANCTGANAQYGTTQECTNACNLLQQGAASDTTGNTVGCRIYHAGLALTAPSPHCWHAGPYGYGVCGGQCESFCTLATGWCSVASGFDGGPPPYASTTDCTTACAAYSTIATPDGGGAVDGGYNAAGPTAGPTLDCREYHLGAALNVASGGAAQQLHCTHVGMTSPTCH